MPRTPDPGLEHRIVMAAMGLLDAGGEAAVTMRMVAREAETTTPTLYDRFPDRESLMRSVVQRAEREILDALEPLNSVEKLAREFLHFACRHPARFNLTVRVFAARLAAGAPMPVYALLKLRLSEEIGVQGRKREDLALAIASLLIGTARGMIASGFSTHSASELRRTALGALQLLLKAFAAASD